LESDLALAAERLGNAGQRRQTAADERVQAERRAAQAEREHEAAAAERTAAERDLAAVQSELGARTGEENDVRGRLTAERLAVRELEEALQRRAEMARSLEIEVGRWTASAASCASSWRSPPPSGTTVSQAAQAAARDADAAVQRVNRDAHAAVRAVEALQHARRHVAALHEQEMSARSARRQTEAALAQLGATLQRPQRRAAVEETARWRGARGCCRSPRGREQGGPRRAARPAQLVLSGWPSAAEPRSGTQGNRGAGQVVLPRCRAMRDGGRIANAMQRVPACRPALAVRDQLGIGAGSSHKIR